MRRELLIEAAGAEARIAVLEDDTVVDLIVERETGESLVGNIYLGRVQRVIAGIAAAFVDIGLPKAAFLPLRGGDTVVEGGAVRVQVTRDAFGDKGVQLSLYPTLAGRLLVYAPSAGRNAVSRQIEDESERSRLLAIAAGLAAGDEGFIVRTVAEGTDAARMAEEAERLRDGWDGIVAIQAGAEAPATLYRDLDLLQRALRDHAQDDISAIHFDDPAALADARDFCTRFAPVLLDRLALHDGAVPLFEARGVEDAVEIALQPRVSLPSGGSIVVEATEALTVIDVNSGRFVDGADPGESALRTNREAAEEIARQIRLRNVGGVIVVDFIDMEDERGWQETLELLAAGFATDRVHCRLVGRTAAGLVELIRRRRRPPLAEILLAGCDACVGTGLLKKPETVAFEILRALRREAAHGLAGPLALRASPAAVAALDAMTRLDGRHLADLVGRGVTVRADAGYAVDEFDIFVDREGDGDETDGDV